MENNDGKNSEILRKALAALEKRAEILEKRFDRIIGKADEFTPRTSAIMREGVPLEIYSRLSLMNAGFDVHGIYSFPYRTTESQDIERSVDVYAVRDSVYTFPEGKGRMSGQSWPERTHVLVEVKQRRPGVEWVFSHKPITHNPGTAHTAPVVDTGFEIRPSESGMSSAANPKDVNNAIAQLNQAYMPFHVGLLNKENLVQTGISKQYSAHHGREDIILLLITNAKIKVFNPPNDFYSMDEEERKDEVFFSEEPWVIFHPENSMWLRHHQKHTAQKAFPPLEQGGSKYEMMQSMVDSSHEVHIVNFDHLGKFFDMIKDPPRLGSINLNVSVEGAKPSDGIQITIE